MQGHTYEYGLSLIMIYVYIVLLKAVRLLILILAEPVYTCDIVESFGISVMCI